MSESLLQFPSCPSLAHDRRRPVRRDRRPKRPDRHQALELLAACPDGCTEGLMVANGFTVELLLDLVQAGLTTAHAERMVAGGKVTEVARLGITDEGRRVLATTGGLERPMDFEPWRQEMATRSLVLPEQFEIDENGITHKPTGWKFIPYPGDPINGTVIEGAVGNRLETGEDFRSDDVREMAIRLWLKHLKDTKKIP